MEAARSRNASDPVVQAEGHRVAQGLLRRLLHDASPLAREQYAALLAHQLRSARSNRPPGCRAILAGEPGARRGLPVELVLLESAWMVATASEPPARAQAHRTTALELEVIRRTLGDSAPAQLARLWGSTLQGGGAGECDASIALLDHIARLQVGPRQLAAQMLFHRP